MPQATPWRRLDKTGHAGRKISRSRARKSRNEIFFACNAIMYEQYVILHRLGPPVGDPTAMYAPPLRYKRVALATDTQTHSGLRTRHAKTLNLLRAQAIQHTVDVGNYAPAARTTLNLLCSSHPSTEIGLILANPRVLILWA